MQLVDITVHEGTSGESRYSFGYDKLDRYVQLALDAGMEYFEISHLFSQWGAIHAPKVMATVISGGVSEYRRIFGWETDACGDRVPRLHSRVHRRTYRAHEGAGA